ncbi:transglutaminase domain-containing protein [Pyrobaculum sp.]|uniref:transglutaminase domain-containing protein n=1 Tax=Pyrobaculum sp. TaxID=2004705 RepID=UPI0031777D74
MRILLAAAGLVLVYAGIVSLVSPGEPAASPQPWGFSRGIAVRPPEVSLSGGLYFKTYLWARGGGGVLYLRCYVYSRYEGGTWLPTPEEYPVLGVYSVTVGRGPFTEGGALNLTLPLMGGCVPVATPSVDGLQLGSIKVSAPGANLAASRTGLYVAYAGGRLGEVTSYYGPGDLPPSPDDLSLPSGQAGVLLALARNITAGCGDVSCKVERIKEFLKGFTYDGTMDAPWPHIPPGVDPLMWFLQNKRGVCVHFATAFVMLARASGVHVRLVVGYMSDGPVPTQWSLTAFSPHAWAEYYQPGVGWIGVEATPPMGAPSPAAPPPRETPTPAATTPEVPPASPGPYQWPSIGLGVFLPLAGMAAAALVGGALFKKRVVITVGEALRVGAPRGFWVYVNRRRVGRAPVEIVFDKPGLYLVAVGPFVRVVRVVDYRSMAGRAFEKLLKKLKLPPSATPREVAERFPQYREVALLVEKLRFGPRADNEDYRRLREML